jgi:hypothetical protein
VDAVAGPKMLTARDFAPAEGITEIVGRTLSGEKAKPYRPTADQRAAIRQSERDFKAWERG